MESNGHRHGPYPTTVELDWSDDEDPVGIVAAAQFGVEAKTLAEQGPAGGWPVVRFSGEFPKILDLVEAYHLMSQPGRATGRVADDAATAIDAAGRMRRDS